METGMRKACNCSELNGRLGLSKTQLIKFFDDFVLASNDLTTLRKVSQSKRRWSWRSLWTCAALGLSAKAPCIQSHCIRQIPKSSHLDLLITRAKPLCRLKPTRICLTTSFASFVSRVSMCGAEKSGTNMCVQRLRNPNMQDNTISIHRHPPALVSEYITNL